MNLKEKPYREQPLIFIDIETTGLSLERHEIIEIASLQVSQTDFSIQKEFSSKVAPSHIETAEKEALELVGYTEKKWEHASSLKNAITEFSKMAQNGIPVGHVIHFDLMFLQKAFGLCNLPFLLDYHYLDTVSIAYAKLKDDALFDVSLTALLKRFNIHRDRAHEAQEDIRATYELFKCLFVL